MLSHANILAAILCEICKVGRIGLFSYEIGDIQSKIIARPDEHVYSLEADVVRIDVVRRVPSQRFHCPVRFHPRILWMRSDESMFPIRLVPYRNNSLLRVGVL